MTVRHHNREGIMHMDYSKLVTENRNSESMELDTLSSFEAAKLMNRMDAEITAAIEKTLPDIAAVIDRITEAYKKGGRLVYCGAGTSGRLGVLDASECLPTFGAGSDMVTAVMAGGIKALTTAVEGAEDDAEQGVSDLREIGFCAKDVLAAVSASGSAAYCAGALRYARSLGAFTAGISCVPSPAFAPVCDELISVVTGPEVLTGSTRLRAGTATKMVLNMLTTISMVQYGKVYKNLMVDMIPTNKKLKDRAVRIIMAAANTDRKTAEEALKKCGNKVKPAIVCCQTGTNYDTAEKALNEASGFVGKAIEIIRKGKQKS